MRSECLWRFPLKEQWLWRENPRGFQGGGIWFWMWFLNVWYNVLMNLKYACQQYFTYMCFLGFIRYNKTFIAYGFRKYENLFTHEYHIWYSWVNKFPKCHELFDILYSIFANLSDDMFFVVAYLRPKTNSDKFRKKTLYWPGPVNIIQIQPFYEVDTSLYRPRT
jgi:hypothetical protein